jgi:hypothetical protein
LKVERTSTPALQKHIPLIVVASTTVVLAAGYFVYDRLRPHCDALFEQTATRLRLGGDFESIRAKGELFIGRERVQELTESNNNVALHLKACCIAQQAGTLGQERVQACIDGAKDYETKVLQVTNIINEAQAAKEQGNTEVLSQKAEQAKQAVDTVISAAADLQRVAAASPGAPDRGIKEGKDAAPLVSVKGGVEQEPNNSLPEANLAQIGTTIVGEISPAGDVDSFLFHYVSKLRDIVQVKLSNQSTTLTPALALYNQSKARIGNWYSSTAGSDLSFSFSADPGQDYFVQVSSFASDVGKYTLAVLPQRAYDEYEPNDDVFHATLWKAGQEIVANVMDAQDVDWYRLTGLTQKQVTVHFENQSMTLVPIVTLHNQSKAQIDQKYSVTAGADLDLSFSADPGQDYYIQVAAFGGSSAGKYKLIVR